MQTSTLGKPQKLTGAETRADGNHAVMHSHVCPTEKELGSGQKEIRQDVPFKVGNNNGAAGHAVEAGKQGGNPRIFKVMQEERTENVVEAGGLEGQVEGVGLEFRMGSVREIDEIEIEAGHLSGGIEFRDQLGSITGGSADIEQRESRIAVYHLGQDLANNGVPAKARVQAHNIGEV
jgi:hypothetical protein